MKPANAVFKSEDILACTPQGVSAASDPASKLASGFRDVLKAINGKRTIADLQAFLSQLDPLKIGIWLDDARRMDLVKIVNPAAPASAAAPAAFEYGAYIERDAEVAALAADISRWVKQKSQSGVRARTPDLGKTVSQATLVAGAALESLQSTGAFSSSGSLDIFIEGLSDPVAVEPPPAEMFPAIGGPKKVALLVEDEIPELGTLAGLLGAAGYEIRAVATRKQFVDAMNGPLPPDIIFLKFESPVIDAFKTLDKVRQHPQLGKLPIVISSEQPSREQIAKSILLGATGWVVRPFTAEKIAASLSGALTGMN